MVAVTIHLLVGLIVALLAMTFSLITKVLKTSKVFNLFTWLMFFNVISAYFLQAGSSNFKDLADVWSIFAIGYVVIFEYGEWIDYDAINR